jgi:membrane protein YqaA with SNARE-associated domain
VTEELLTTFGLYGAALVVGLVAGLFPLVSIEVFLIAVAALRHPSYGELAVLIVLGSLGHQIAKTITYYGSFGVVKLPEGRIKKQLDRAQKYIDRFNRYPKSVLFLSATVGLPPIYMVGFIAGPLMKIRFAPFTAIVFVGRICRYSTVALIVPLLF